MKDYRYMHYTKEALYGEVISSCDVDGLTEWAWLYAEDYSGDRDDVALTLAQVWASVMDSRGVLKELPTDRGDDWTDACCEAAHEAYQAAQEMYGDAVIA